MSGTGQALIGKHDGNTDKRCRYYLCGEAGHYCKNCPKNVHQNLSKSKHESKFASLISEGESYSDS